MSAPAALELPATATHHVSRLHGLRTRTRTAVINAAMIPRMLETADMTERAVRAAGIAAPLMIMRSDGGVMDVEEMRRRPILTMLSGPAAGVAAALLFAGVSDGIFLEVGGTSTDVSVIRNGRCQIRSAEIGGCKLHLETLDVRTIGVAGGSLVEPGRPGTIVAVGPRSAHIAGLPYLCFSEHPAKSLKSARYETPDDPAERLCARAGEALLAVTPTCAANVAGLVPRGDPAAADASRTADGFAQLAPELGFSDQNALADAILRSAAMRVGELVRGLIRDYRLDPALVRLVGGGGGASAIVPAVARELGLPFENVRHADVISAIGVALALLRDSVERTAVNPTEEDIRRIRAEAFESVLRMGAAPETIQVFVEVDTRRNLLRATAEGATDIHRPEPVGERSSAVATIEETVRTSFGKRANNISRGSTAGGFELWTAELRSTGLLAAFRRTRPAIRVVDGAGRIRWASNSADWAISMCARAPADLLALAERHTRYSDAGATIPRCFALADGRIVDLSGLCEASQVAEVLRWELQRVGGGEACILLVEFA
ncbi:MAG: hydantoinase/oxoprolinase [Phycisphaerales bacterium]|nr:hydantoinase/oxoprolinase [Phycisphaerales bacterium]